MQTSRRAVLHMSDISHMLSEATTMQALSLESTSATIAFTYYEASEVEGYDTFIIDGLTGCMGMICVINKETGLGRKALLVHDSDTGYPNVKTLLGRFIEENPADVIDMQVVWGARSYVNQTEWIRSRGIQVVRECAQQKTLVWPDSYEAGGAAPITKGIRVPLRSGRGLPSLKVLGKDNPLWQRDSDAAECSRCKKRFSLFLRRHHCRNCGMIFCDDCTTSVNGLGEPWSRFSLSQVTYRCCFACLPQKPIVNWQDE